MKADLGMTYERCSFALTQPRPRKSAQTALNPLWQQLDRQQLVVVIVAFICLFVPSVRQIVRRVRAYW